jgi:hypothetical protein
MAIPELTLNAASFASIASSALISSSPIGTAVTEGSGLDMADAGVFLGEEGSKSVPEGRPTGARRGKSGSVSLCKVLAGDKV